MEAGKILSWVFFFALVFGIFSNCNGDTNTNFENFCSCLINSGIISENVVIRNHSNEKYEHLNYQWLIRENPIYPLAYLLLQNEEEVASSLKCGYKHSIRLVAKSGGHSYEKFSFGDENTVIIDLRDMDSIVYSKSEMKVTLGPGVLVVPTMHKLLEMDGVIIPGHSTCPTVGVSGATMGGGYGVFRRQDGIMSDHVLEMNIVVANATVLKVNNETNVDLYFALRGDALASYGIITKLVFEVVPAPELVFDAILTFKSTQFPELFNAWQHYLASNPPFSVMCGLIYSLDNTLGIRFIDGSGKSTNFEEALHLFSNHETISTNTYTYPEFLVLTSVKGEELLNENVKLTVPSDLNNLERESQAQVYMKRKSFYVKSLANMETIDEIYSLFRNKPSTVKLELEPDGGLVSKVGKNETAFVHRDSLYNILISNIIYKPENGSWIPGNEWMRRLCDIGYNLLNSTETYQNYVDMELTDHLRRYYGSNIQRLVEIKRKFDPTNYFNNPQSIPTTF